MEENDIAVIGLAGIFPGASNVSEYWHNLKNGIQSITHFQRSLLLKEHYIVSELVHNPDYVLAKGYIDKATWFAANFFDIPEKKAKILDPQFRLFLECVWQAFQDAGYDAKAYPTKVGVYACSGTKDSYYQQNLLKNEEVLEHVDSYELLINNGKDFLATFIAYYLNFTGPCINIQTACSSSLVAVCQACDDLRLNKCDLAVAGGISITFPLKAGHLYKQGMIYSRDGYCKPFTKDATGIVNGNGGGVVLLKKYKQAVKDKDSIYAVIKGYSVNNDGHNKLSFTAPSLNGQHDVLIEASKNSGIKPSQLDYIETHGTGTRLGDQIELAALEKFLSSSNKSRSKPCYLGTVKSNIGHLDVASGIAGLIKTILVLNENIIPPALHTDNSVEELVKNDRMSLPLTAQKNINFAGVSSFGVGGTNAHIILQRYEGQQKAKIKVSQELIRQNYCIDSPIIKEKIKNTQLNAEKNLNQFLKNQSWIKSESIINKNISNSMIIIEDKDKICNDVYGYFLNNYSDIHIEVLKYPRKNVDENLEDFISRRLQEWQKIFIKFDENLEISVLHIAYSKEEYNFEAAKIACFYDFLAMMKAIMQTNFNHTINLLSLTNQLFRVINGDSISINQSILLGPVQCVPLEYPFISWRCVDLDKIDVGLFDIIEKELVFNNQDRLVAYRADQRYISTIQEAKALSEDKFSTSFKNNGTYLITGGLGGIGLALANYLAGKYNANLILISKTPIPTKNCWQGIVNDERSDVKLREKLNKLLGIKLKANKLVVLNVDIGNDNELINIIKQADIAIDNINGVIHAASQYPAGLLHNKNIADIEAMFASKIYGLNNLSKLLINSKLDFMLLFSAENTFVGAVGATDYVSSNAYLDNFAKYHVSNSAYPIIAIDWDTWTDAGMYYETYLREIKEIDLTIKKYKNLLLEHKINNKIVIPGSMLIEIVIDHLIREKNNNLPIKLENLSFIQMAIINEFFTDVISSRSNQELFIYQNDNHLIFNARIGQINDTSVNNLIIKNTNLASGEVIDFINLDGNKIQLGEHWHCLKWIKKIDHKYFAHIKLPNKFSNEENNYTLHPVLLDVGYSFHSHLFNGQYVPFYIEELVIYKKLPMCFNSKVEIIAQNNQSDICKANITFFTDDMKIILEAKNFLLKKIEFLEKI